MFKVMSIYNGDILTVFSTRLTESGATYFLIHNHIGWSWVPASVFEPYQEGVENAH